MLEIVYTSAQSVPTAEENDDTQPRGAYSRGGEWEAFILRTTPGPKYAEASIILFYFIYQVLGAQISAPF